MVMANEENFLNNPQENLEPVPFEPEALEKVAQSFQEGRREEVAAFVKKLKESISAGINLDELVAQVVGLALEVEFGEKFIVSAEGKKVIGAVSRVIQDDPDLLERTVAVALKSFLEKKKDLS